VKVLGIRRKAGSICREIEIRVGTAPAFAVLQTAARALLFGQRGQTIQK